MADDLTYVTKVYEGDGGDSIYVKAGGKIIIGGVTLTADAAGNLIATGLPTADPHVVGAIYSATDVLTVSAG